MCLVHGIGRILWTDHVSKVSSHLTRVFVTVQTCRLLAAPKFQVSLKQDGSTSLATWHIQIPGKIITELSVRRCNHQETGGDLEGTRVPPR